MSPDGSDATTTDGICRVLTTHDSWGVGSMDVSRSRWVSKAMAKAVLASLVVVAGLTIVAVPDAFAATPTVSSVVPASGFSNGGTTVTVNGSGFGTTAVPNV